MLELKEIKNINYNKKNFLKNYLKNNFNKKYLKVFYYIYINFIKYCNYLKNSNKLKSFSGYGNLHKLFRIIVNNRLFIKDIINNQIDKEPFDYYSYTEGFFEIVSNLYSYLRSEDHYGNALSEKEYLPLLFCYIAEPNYISKSGSIYWYTEKYLYRLSNHWGQVASCEWILRKDFRWRPYRLGRIKWDKLKRIPKDKRNPYYLFRDKSEECKKELQKQGLIEWDEWYGCYKIYGSYEDIEKALGY